MPKNLLSCLVSVSHLQNAAGNIDAPDRSMRLVGVDFEMVMTARGRHDPLSCGWLLHWDIKGESICIESLADLAHT